MNPAGSICLALFLTVFGVAFFWYVWVRTFEWELAVWYRAIVNQRTEDAVEAVAEDVEMAGSAAGGSKAQSNKSGVEAGGEGGSKSPSKHGSNKSGEGGSKAASKKSGSKSGGEEQT